MYVCMYVIAYSIVTVLNALIACFSGGCIALASYNKCDFTRSVLQTNVQIDHYALMSTDAADPGHVAMDLSSPGSQPPGAPSVLLPLYKRTSSGDDPIKAKANMVLTILKVCKSVIACVNHKS